MTPKEAEPLLREKLAAVQARGIKLIQCRFQTRDGYGVVTGVCAIGAYMLDTKIEDAWISAAARSFGVYPEDIREFTSVWDRTQRENETIHPWARLGLKLREEFKPIPYFEVE